VAGEVTEQVCLSSAYDNMQLLQICHQIHNQLS
jgi:hypothetical protein